MIRPWCDDDSLERLTDMLHRAYAPLADRGLNYTATDQGPEVTRKRIASGECYLAIVDGVVKGTVTLYPPGAASADCAWYARPDVLSSANWVSIRRCSARESGQLS